MAKESQVEVTYVILGVRIWWQKQIQNSLYPSRFRYKYGIFLFSVTTRNFWKERSQVNQKILNWGWRNYKVRNRKKDWEWGRNKKPNQKIVKKKFTAGEGVFEGDKWTVVNQYSQILWLVVMGIGMRLRMIVIS